MALTSIPQVGTGQNLGPTKSDARAATDTSRQLAATEWNAAAVALEEVCEAVGLATGATSGSIEAERLKNATEIGEALADGDYIPIANVSDVSVEATGTVRKTLLSRLKTYFFGATEIGGALADSDTIMVKDATDSAVKTSLLSRLSTYIQSAIPIAYGTWTPTTAIVANIDTVTSAGGRYIRVGDIVFFSVYCAVDATAVANLRFNLTLPVASAFTALADLTGSANGMSISGGYSAADITNDRIDVYAAAIATTVAIVTVTGAYRVL